MLHAETTFNKQTKKRTVNRQKGEDGRGEEGTLDNVFKSACLEDMETLALSEREEMSNQVQER